MKKVNLNIPFEVPVKAPHYITGLIKYLNDEFDQVSVADNLVSKYHDDKSSKYYINLIHTINTITIVVKIGIKTEVTNISL